MDLSKEKLIQIFIDKLGEPNSLIHLSKYFDFLLFYDLINEDAYIEKHHILPVCTFNKYSKDSWNLIILEYLDHIKAYELLFKAYNIRKYQWSLHYMKSQLNKDSKLISNAAKKGWKSLKDNKKNYDKWRKSRSKYMLNILDEHQNKISKSIKLNWDNLSESEYKNRCKINKENWTEERKRIKSKQMIEYCKNNLDKIKERNQNMWDSVTPEFRNEFKSKITEINRNPEKRRKAGDSIKNKWKDPIFRQKMKSRKNAVKKYIAILPSGEIIERIGMIEMIKEFNFSPYLVRKYTNSGETVDSKHSKNKQVANTIGWKFETK